MVNEYIENLFEQLFNKKYYRYKNLKAEIMQIMWAALYVAQERYRRYAGIYEPEYYAEKVILNHVDQWIKENGFYRFGTVSLNQKLGDNACEMIELLADECPYRSLELFDFLSRLSRIKYMICKAYIFFYKDSEIADLLSITRKRLNEIKRELQDDFRKGYLI